MLKSVNANLPADGRTPETPSGQLAPSSTSASSPFRLAAAKATDDLFRFCEPLDVGDPEAFFAAVIGVFLEFPIAVMETVADPVRGLPSRVRRPHLTDIRKACEDAYAPVARQLARDRAVADSARLLASPSPVPKLTVGELEAKLGRPLPTLRRMNEPGRRFKSIDEAEAAAAEMKAAPPAPGMPEPPEAA